MFFSLQDVTVILNGHTVEGEQTISRLRKKGKAYRRGGWSVK